jgi:hypothetical protein
MVIVWNFFYKLRIEDCFSRIPRGTLAFGFPISAIIWKNIYIISHFKVIHDVSIFGFWLDEHESVVGFIWYQTKDKINHKDLLWGIEKL